MRETTREPPEYAKCFTLKKKYETRARTDRRLVCKTVTDRGEEAYGCVGKCRPEFHAGCILGRATDGENSCDWVYHVAKPFVTLAVEKATASWPKTIASGVGLHNAWLQEQGLLSIKALWAELAPLRRNA